MAIFGKIITTVFIVFMCICMHNCIQLSNSLAAIEDTLDSMSDEEINALAARNQANDTISY